MVDDMKDIISLRLISKKKYAHLMRKKPKLLSLETKKSKTKYLVNRSRLP
jgi:hypothetical protein